MSELSVCDQILTGDEIEACVTVEPYMLGDFVKLTNNKEKKNSGFQATAYGLAFGHFTYLLSGCQEVVVDLQGGSLLSGIVHTRCVRFVPAKKASLLPQGG